MEESAHKRPTEPRTPGPVASGPLEEEPGATREALFYERLGDDRALCHLCTHECKIARGRTGICGARAWYEDKLVSLVWGHPLAEHVDPIEKKPLYHFLPGTRAYSIGTAGCNFACAHCQNADISQIEAAALSPGPERTPGDIVRSALETGSSSIAFTYTEPTVFFEYSLDTARLAREKGLKNVWVTNGYLMEDPARTIAPFLDAANVDLKAFSEETYKTLCKARLEPVKQNIRLLKELGVWVEVTTLVIPGVNDDPAQLRGIAEFLASVGRDIPWHVSRFHPAFKLTDRPPTPLGSLNLAWELGRNAGLKYVYQGNIPGSGNENTYCHQCGETVLARAGLRLLENRLLPGGLCPRCSAAVDGVWSL